MYQCNWCHREFKRKSDLGNHITRKHVCKQDQKESITKYLNTK